MRVLVTGATGRVGSVLLDCIPPDMEAEILLGPGDLHTPPFPWYRADIAERDRTFMAVTCAHPDAIVHLAAMTDVDGCERDPESAMRVNRDGSRTIAEAARECGAAMVYLSTDYVFDGCSGPYAETDAPNPVNVYGRSKLAGEEEAARVLERLAVVRISMPFSIKRDGAALTFLSLMDERLSGGTAVRAAVDQVTTPAWLDELAELVWAAIRNDARGIVHFGTPDRLSRYDMVRELCRARGYDDSLVEPVKTADFSLTALRPLESGFITGSAASLLGRTPASFRAALETMYTVGGQPS